MRRAAQRLGAELRSQNDPILDQIPTEVMSDCRALTDGVSSSDLLGRLRCGPQCLPWDGAVMGRLAATGWQVQASSLK